jgi:1-acyl-sn-glycerol-3-phosphate acyltransferase
MIKAQKSRAFEHLFQCLNRWLLFQSFDCIFLRTPQHPISMKKPTVYFVNHSNWWDALLIFQLNYSILHQEAFGMMSKQGLTQFPFFRKLGVFSVDRQSLREIKQSLDYAVELMHTDYNSLWIFPQGDVFHQEKRPLAFLPGLGYLFEKCKDVQWIPVTFYYSYALVRQPNIYIEIGSPLSTEHTVHMSRADQLAHAQQILTRQLDRVREDIIHERIEEFKVLWQGFTPTKQSFNEIFQKK